MTISGRAYPGTETSRERRALEAIRTAPEGKLTKSELARAVWGEVSQSTQAMATRLTRTMLERRSIVENRDGRIVYVTLAAATAGGEDELADGRPFDRPYVHLVDAAEWGLAHGSAGEFAASLEIIKTQSKSDAVDAREDRKALHDRAQSLEGDPRKSLVDVLAQFGLERERDFLATDLLVAWKKLGAVSSHDHDIASRLVWVVMALAVNQRLRLLGGDRAHKHQSLLDQRVRSALRRIRARAPVHAAYLEALRQTAKGGASESVWRSVQNAKPLDEDPAVERMRAQGEFNAGIAALDTFLRRELRPEVFRRIGFAEGFTHDQGAPIHAAERFAVDHERDFRDSLLRISKHELGALRPTLESLRDRFADLKNHLSGSANYHLRMVDSVLGKTFDPQTEGLPAQYDRLIRNNFWTPEMLWHHVAITKNV